MCGIVGIADLKSRPVDRDLLVRMRDAMVHRGPDECGEHFGAGVALGHRRLSIIDLSTGRQPLANEDRTVWVTFNGEIYNFQSLRADLQGRGHRFATNTDTETIVHAYEEFGERFLQKLRGMFALAIWDERKRLLLLARDRVGKKPLFYAQADGCFLFASELQALVAHPAVAREIDLAALDEYVTYGYVPAPKTIYQNVFKLPPAHLLTLEVRGSEGRDQRSEGRDQRSEGRDQRSEGRDQRSEGSPGGRHAGRACYLPAPGTRHPAPGFSGTSLPAPCTPLLSRYWQLEYGPKLEIDEEEAAGGLLEVLTEAVRLRMVADVPLGALLSGGIDSGIIVALMSKLSSRPVKTFTIGFDEGEFDESPFARQVAERYGTEHHELIVRPNALEVLPTLVRHYGEPFADSSAVPSFYVSQMTRQHVTVALNGDGGDESMAGYERYLGSLLARRYRRIPRLARQWVVEPLAALVPDSLPRRNRLRQTKRFVQSAALPTSECYLGWLSYFTDARKARLYAPEFRHELNGHQGSAWFADLFGRCRGETRDDLDAVMATDVESYLPYDLLVKMDIATMANSLEARSPFLDHEVMEYCARLPGRYKLRGGTLKYLLKRIGGDLLPAATLARRKMGFGVPVAQWLRGELGRVVAGELLSPAARTRRYFAPQAIRQLLDEHQHQGQDHSFQLWSLYWLELWHQEFIG